MLLQSHLKKMYNIKISPLDWLNRMRRSTQVSCCVSAGEAASGGGEEAAGDSQRSAEAGRPHRAGQRHKHTHTHTHTHTQSDVHYNTVQQVTNVCVRVCAGLST